MTSIEQDAFLDEIRELVEAEVVRLKAQNHRQRQLMGEAQSVIDRLIEHLDQTTPDEPWQDAEGHPVPAVRNWLLLTCTRADHDLYDDIMALKGRLP